MLERTSRQYPRSRPSSCEYFPPESCYSLKACTSTLVLAANEVRSHFEGKVFTLVPRRYFLHISPPLQRMSTDGTTSKAVLKKPNFCQRNSSQLSRLDPDLNRLKSFHWETALRSYINLNF